MSKLSASAIAGGNQGRREMDDFYPTDPRATYAILEREELRGSIYEPACGDGAISEILKEYYPNSEVYSTDLIDRGYGEDTGIDFLTYPYARKWDNIITNPPFRYAKDFVERALALSNNKVIMLMRINFLESASRYELFKNTPLKKVYVFSKRLDIYKNGIKGKNSGITCYCWFVWEHGYKGEPTLDWIL
mgnify:FL=1